MKKLSVTIILLFIFSNFINAQDSLNTKKTNWKKIDLSNRPNDHFMIQYGFDGWQTDADSTKPSGFSRHFNFYFMYDKPFKSAPHFSVAIGAGIGSSNMFFKDEYIDVKSITSTLPFTDLSAQSHFKKYKLTTIFLEVPVELRIVQNPVTPDKGFKFAIGAKIGTLLNAHTKGKDFQDVNGATIYGPKYIMKENDKRFINTPRLAVTSRIGYGNLTLDGSYQITPFLKTGSGPVIHPYSIGLTLSGL